MLLLLLLLQERGARLRETNWSSKNGGFADGLVNLPRKKKVLISKDAQPWISADQFDYLGCELSLDGEPDFDKNKQIPRNIRHY